MKNTEDEFLSCWAWIESDILYVDVQCVCTCDIDILVQRAIVFILLPYINRTTTCFKFFCVFFSFFTFFYFSVFGI